MFFRSCFCSRLREERHRVRGSTSMEQQAPDKQKAHRIKKERIRNMTHRNVAMYVSGRELRINTLKLYAEGFKEGTAQRETWDECMAQQTSVTASMSVDQVAAASTTTTVTRKRRAAELGVKEKEEKHQEDLRRAQGQLKKRPAATKAKFTALMNAAPCSEGNPPRSKADSALVTAADHGSQSATGPTRKDKEKDEEKEEEEEDKRQAELRHAQDKLKKCLEDEDYRGAAVAKANMTALMRAAPCSQGNPPRSKADLAVAMATGLAIP